MERLVHILPDLAKELENVLFEMGEYKLARTVDQLEVVERCRCGDSECATIYTKEETAWKGKPIKHLVPGCDGLYEVDVYDGSIVCIEILERDDVAQILNEVLP